MSITNQPKRLDLRETGKGRKVYVVSGAFDYDVARMFLYYGYRGTRDVDQADVVCWTGGADINPALYNQKPLTLTRTSPGHDKIDMLVWKRIEGREDVLRVGICRGGQFLNVMSGGSMWQHLDKHTASHKMFDMETQELITVSSLHHQQMRPSAEGLILGYSNLATQKYDEFDTWELKKDGTTHKYARDIEAVWYAKTKSLCYQPHPELEGYRDCTDFLFRNINKYCPKPPEGSTQEPEQIPLNLLEEAARAVG